MKIVTKADCVNLDSNPAQSENMCSKSGAEDLYGTTRMPLRLLMQTFGRWHSGKFASGTAGAAIAI